MHIQSWPSIEKFKFRLGSVVSGLSSLRRLSARILEPNGLLTDQILGAFGPKLRELEITGQSLHTVTLDAFDGIESQQLRLAIRGTRLKQLPRGFYKVFQNVAHLSLDLRDNRLETLSPEVLYHNASQPKAELEEVVADLQAAEPPARLVCCQLEATDELWPEF